MKEGASLRHEWRQYRERTVAGISASIDISEGFAAHDRIAVVVTARVDQSWRQQGDNVSPKVPPQSHMVNARTDPSWYHESGGKSIQGRVEWVSIPLTIVIGEHYDSTGSEGEWIVETFEISDRFVGGSTDGDGTAPAPGTAPATRPTSPKTPSSTAKPGSRPTMSKPDERWSFGKRFITFFIFMARWLDNRWPSLPSK
jgi:hypothetical protein